MSTIEELRTLIADARSQLIRYEAQAETTAGELAGLEKQAKELGIAPNNLVEESDRIHADVEEAVAGVSKELEAVRHVGD